MENPLKPERELILGVTPIAFCLFGPLVILGVSSAFTRLVMKLVEFFR